MADTKEFETLLVASASCGAMLAEGIRFDQVHEVSEWVLGHPIWTHEFADRALWVRISEAIRGQHAGMPKERDATMSMEDVSRIVSDALELFGPKVLLVRGTAQRAESPVASLQRLMPGKPVIVMVGEDGKGG